MNMFNWRRALEGASVTAIVTGLDALSPLLSGNFVHWQVAVGAFVVSVVVGTIKGFGQSYIASNTTKTP